MKIALVSRSNGCFGGASFFAESLAAWLQEAALDVTQFCVEPHYELQPFQRRLSATGPLSRVLRHVNWRARQWGVVERLPWEFWFGLRHQGEPFDLVHFHDIYRAISPHTLQSVAGQKPVVVTVHDCSVFTGGCLYPLSCQRYHESCGACPQARAIGRFDFTRSNLKMMRRLARTSNVHYTFPSRWIRTEASRALRFRGVSAHIPNGLDPRAYAYPDRALARASLGFDPTQRTVVISAAALDDQRKGVDLAVRALVANRDLKLGVIVIGQSSPALAAALQGMNVILAGFVADRARLGRFYAAADLLVFPSLADNLPVTIQEAMAAGTPVLAFDVGGVPELVRPGQTGWLVPVGDQAALSRQLREVLQRDDLARFGERARTMIREEFSVAKCVDQYVNLYRQILEAANLRREEA